MDLTWVSGVGLRGKNTGVSGLVNFQMPNRSSKGDIKKTVKYIKSKMENKGHRWYLSLVDWSVDKKSRGKDRALGYLEFIK